MKSTELIEMTKNQISPSTEQVINQITTVWNKATEYIIEVSKLLHKYQSNTKNQKLWLEVRDELIERKIMSRTVIYNLTKIGENQLLTSNSKFLPPAYNTIYELSKFDDDVLAKMFDEKLINPELRLDEVRKLKGSIITDIEFETIEEVIEPKDMKRGITIFFKEDDIINKHELIEENIRKIQSMLSYAEVEVTGLLKRKIDGD
jgi:site-specific DNA-adenine methylase